MAGWKLRKDKTQTETPHAENGAAAPPPPTEFAVPPRESEALPASAREAESDPLPLPVSRWDLPADDWSVTPPALPVEDTPIIAEEAAEDDEPKPARVFDLIDTTLSPAEAEAALTTAHLGDDPLEEEPLEAEDLLFEDDEPAQPDPLPMPTFTEAEAMPEAVAATPVFTPTEPAPEAVAAAPPRLGEPDTTPSLISFVEPEPRPEDLPTALNAVPAVPPHAPTAPLFGAPPVATESITSTLRLDRSELGGTPQTPTGANVPTVAPFILDVPPVAPPADSAERRLTVRFGRLSATFPLSKDVTIIGRPDSELHYYPDIEIELDDAVSRRHAEVLRRGEDYFLVDAGSTNGTLLNGEMLPPHEERLLAHGDRIRVGERSEIIFE